MAEASKNMVTQSSAGAAGSPNAHDAMRHLIELLSISAAESGCREPAGSSRRDRKQEKFPLALHRAADRSGAPSRRRTQRATVGQACRRASWASSFKTGERLAPYRV